ncbi:MAG: NAD-dependent epimerase/dehydratase family protein [Gaiellaceae bacterium]
MRAFVTGGTGFLGGRLVERLRGRGGEVVAIVRSPGKAGRLTELGCELAEGDLASRERLGEAMRGWAHVDDVAAGVLLAHDRGKVGEAYILGGEIGTLRQGVEKDFAAGGRRPRIVPVPTALLRPAAPLGPPLGRNVREILSASDGVTYWGSDAKARRELGYAPSGLAEGLRRTFAG